MKYVFGLTLITFQAVYAQGQWQYPPLAPYEIFVQMKQLREAIDTAPSSMATTLSPIPYLEYGTGLFTEDYGKGFREKLDACVAEKVIAGTQEQFDKLRSSINWLANTVTFLCIALFCAFLYGNRSNVR